MHEFYSASRIVAMHVENLRAFAEFVQVAFQDSKDEETEASSIWIQIERKLERVQKVLVTEQNVALSTIRRDMIKLLV